MPASGELQTLNQGPQEQKLHLHRHLPHYLAGPTSEDGRPCLSQLPSWAAGSLPLPREVSVPAKCSGSLKALNETPEAEVRIHLKAHAALKGYCWFIKKRSNVVTWHSAW